MTRSWPGVGSHQPWEVLLIMVSRDDPGQVSSQNKLNEAVCMTGYVLSAPGMFKVGLCLVWVWTDLH